MERLSVRVKMVVKLVAGEEYRFITEPDSDIKTQWLYDVDKDNLVVSNNNGKIITFLRSSVLYFSEGGNCNFTENICKEISPNIFEINDYLKADSGTAPPSKKD